jgi:hypothetical protein
VVAVGSTAAEAADITANPIPRLRRGESPVASYL